MKQNWGRKAAWLAPGLAILLFHTTFAFSQERKGAFIDGEFVEDFVYVPDFMTPEELKRHIDERSKDIVIVDTAPALIWEDEHIPGAISFPWKASIALPVPLPRDKTLVIYCACNDHEDSVDMAKQLSILGYRNTKVLKGGWFKWLDLGYKTVSKDEEKVTK
jgi:rhodanese-related sulfurtransferase